MSLEIVILAAGMGRRMNSNLPKVIHLLAGRPILQHIIETAKKLNPVKIIIVVGHSRDVIQNQINEIFTNNSFIWTYQSEQLGTADALKCALPYLNSTSKTLILSGDVPLITFATLQTMLDKYQQNLVLITTQLDNPSGYGRIIRDEKQNIIKIAEEKDANNAQKLITEVNGGIYLIANKFIATWLSQLSNNNMQNEYYLTDIIAQAYFDKVEIASVAANNIETLGVNNKTQLEFLERSYQRQIADNLLEKGIIIADKSRIDIRGNIKAGQDCFIDINCIFEGSVTLGNNVRIGMGCYLKNVAIADNVQLKPYSIIEDATINESVKIGPFARIRPKTVLNKYSAIGNFVEVKNSQIGERAKIGHLSYIGDSKIGNNVNIGAGTVTCNYDGKNKYNTIIENNAFIGSGSMLVAPVTIGENSIIGAGSTITKLVPKDELTLSRSKQITITGWLKKKKNNEEF